MQPSLGLRSLARVSAQDCHCFLPASAAKIIFTGVAGGLLEGQSIGDIVVGEDVVNYEFDCRDFKYPWDPKYTRARRGAQRGASFF